LKKEAEEAKKAELERLKKEAEEAKKAEETKRKLEQEKAELERLQKEAEEKRRQELEKAAEIAKRIAEQEKLRKEQEAEERRKSEQNALSEKVFTKAKEFFIKLNEFNALEKLEEGKYISRGHKRTLVLSEKEARFSIYDSQSKEELLRVILGKNPIFSKSLVTFDDLKLFENALKEFDRIQAEKSRTKDRGDELEM